MSILIFLLSHGYQVEMWIGDDGWFRVCARQSGKPTLKAHFPGIDECLRALLAAAQARENE